MLIEFFRVVLTQADNQPSIGPAFTQVMAVSRLNADCDRGCQAMPIQPFEEFEKALSAARWRIKNPKNYVVQFRFALTKYLVDKRALVETDPSFTRGDQLFFETALNVLPPYWSCLETFMRSAADESFADRTSISRLVDQADAKCIERRTTALSRIGFSGPDFHDFDYMADGSKKGSEVASLLKHIQQFVVAYNAGLRGAHWQRAIETIVLPRSVGTEEASSE